jgi:hypothetical protein
MIGVPATGLSWLDETKTSISGYVGSSVGYGLRVQVMVAGQMSSDDAADNVNNLVSYPRPHIHNDIPVTALTAGGLENGPVTIKGLHLGPAGEDFKQYFQSVLIGGQQCTDAIVTEAGTELQCLPPGGTGVGHDVVVVINNAQSTGGQGIFSYLPPEIEAINPPSTGGGSVTVTGMGFGPAGNALTSVRVFTEETCGAGETPSDEFSGAGVPLGCQPVEGIGAPLNVAIVSHSELTFDIGPGTGKNYDIEVTVDGLASGISGARKMAYALPFIDDVTPTSQPENSVASDTRITITGSNFGARSAVVSVLINGRPSPSESIRLYDFGVDGRGEITATVPYGAGDNVFVQVAVDGQTSLPNDEARFSYNAPVALSATAAPTTGGPIIVEGINFGPVGPIHDVLIRDRGSCTQANVTEDDTKIRCYAPAGTGTGLDLFVRVTEDAATESQSSGLGLYSYAAPEVTAVEPAAAEGSDYVVVTGSNFGTDESKLRLCVIPPGVAADAPAEACWFNYVGENDIVKGHMKFVAKMPAGYGNNRPVRVEVDGLLGPAADSAVGATLSYSSPKVVSADPAPTSGGIMRVHGSDYGPVGSTGFQVNSNGVPSRIGE